MLTRILVAQCVLLGFMAPAFAQTPVGLPSVPPIAAGGDQGVGDALSPSYMVGTPVCGGIGCETGCRHGPDFWMTGDFLLAWFTGVRVPPLVTTSVPGTPRADAGVLGLPTTQILFDNYVNEGARAGLRLGGGFVIDRELGLGIRGGGTIIEGQVTNFSQASDGSVILARPFVNALNNQPQSVLVAFPGSSAGTIEGRISSGSFYEGNLDLVETFWDDADGRFDTLVGYRTYRYDEGFRIQQGLFPIPPSPFATGTQILTIDDFSTRNTFHGLDLGLRARFGNSDLSLDLLARVAVGNLRRELTIKGTQTISVPGTSPVFQRGGVYALPSNDGTHIRNDWAAMPELGINLSWRLSQNLLLRMGYTALMLDGIARATEHINTRINPNQFPPATQPLVGPNVPPPNTTARDMWIQSANMGLEYTF